MRFKGGQAPSQGGNITCQCDLYVLFIQLERSKMEGSMSLKSSFQRFIEARQHVAEFQSLKGDLERLLCEVVKIETYV